MEKLQIPSVLKEYVLKLAKKDDLDSADFNDYNVICKINDTYFDCVSFLPKIRPFKFIAYGIVRRYYGLDKVPDDLAVSNIEYILDNVKFTEEEPRSEFFSVLRDVYELIEELKTAINDNKPYLVIKIYKGLYHRLRYETLEGYSGVELQKEVEKRYSYPVSADSILKRINAKDTKISLKDFSLSRTPGKGHYSYTCHTLAKYVHSLVYDYYKKTGTIYYPVNDDISLYKFGKVLIVGYDYLDDLDVYLNDYGAHYNLKDTKFYYLLHQNRGLEMRVDDSTLRSKFDFGLTTIIAPNDHFEEALIKYMRQETDDVKGISEVLTKLSIPEEYLSSNGLFTNNYYTFIPKIKDASDIKVKDIDEYPTLKKITSKSESEKEKYYKKLASYYKGKAKKDYLEKPFEPKPYYLEKKNPKAWWND